jgi:hypothetical protein
MQLRHSPDGWRRGSKALREPWPGQVGTERLKWAVIMRFAAQRGGQWVSVALPYVKVEPASGSCELTGSVSGVYNYTGIAAYEGFYET